MENPNPSSVIGESKTMVLVIDDNQANVRLFVRVLQQLPSMSISTAANGEEAKRVAAKNPPDLILLDVHLPDVEGTSLLEYFKTEPTTTDVPVIMVSSDLQKQTISQFMASGAFDYISKPIDVVDFLSRIRRGIDSAKR